ncbi:hypothetical protein MA16_Dca028081 [Dendrobium catenatum]|uniref:Uncharacterized protein n=1 Tax=Dendrobium catenatum TaxID=906689 RepID=A0A2I0VCX4_9ASPA|nr:hypothetical protein MA16_Dca028081 [Dendrobium catenatum]
MAFMFEDLWLGSKDTVGFMLEEGAHDRIAQMMEDWHEGFFRLVVVRGGELAADFLLQLEKDCEGREEHNYN